MSNDSASPTWSSLQHFCSECFFAARCERFRLIEVLDCEFVRDQEAADLDRRAKGKAPLGPPIPLTTPPDAIVRFRGRPTPEVRRGRRPVDTHGLFRLLLRLARPFGGETA